MADGALGCKTMTAVKGAHPVILASGKASGFQSCCTAKFVDVFSAVREGRCSGQNPLFSSVNDPKSVLN